MISNNKKIPILKKWGQNFLIDNNVIRKIIKIIDPHLDDIIVEPVLDPKINLSLVIKI